MRLGVQDLLRIEKLIDSKYEAKSRACDLVSGDVVYAPMASAYLYVQKNESEIRLLHITKYLLRRPSVASSASQTYVFGLKCQMWVIKKLLKPIKSNYAD